LLKRTYLDIDTQIRLSGSAMGQNESEYTAMSVMTSPNGLSS